MPNVMNSFFGSEMNVCNEQFKYVMNSLFGTAPQMVRALFFGCDHQDPACKDFSAETWRAMLAELPAGEQRKREAAMERSKNRIAQDLAPIVKPFFETLNFLHLYPSNPGWIF